MAPVEPSLANSNVGAYIGLSCSLVVIATVFALVFHTIVYAARSLPIAYRTRAHESQRRNAMVMFSALALVSLLVNIYTFQEMVVNSYWNWAFDNKQVFPVDVWTTPVWYPRAKSTDLQLGRWMKESDLKDCVQVMAGSWRDFWWQQQHAMGTTAWSVFLAIEGRRRNIPYSWAFLPIAHFVGLSVAQNLFYLILLFTPVPLPASAAVQDSSGILAPLKRLNIKVLGDAQSRPDTWVPKPIVYIAPLVFSFGCTAFLPFGIGTPFQDFFLNAPQMVCYLTLLISKTAILPASWGTIHRSIHDAHASTTPVFRTAAILSFILYAASTTLAMLFNTPPARRTFQELLYSDHDTFSLSNLDRYRLAITRIIGALSDHPIVQKIGWDVLLSILSLCVWTGIRGLDVRDMLSSLGFPVASISKAKVAVVRDTKSASLQAANAVKDKTASAVSTAAATATGRKSKASKTTANKSKAASAPSDSDGPDDESADLGAADHAFKPSSGLGGAHVEHEEDRGATDVAEGAEGAALAWGFAVVGGLGFAVAGVVGAEAM